MPEATVICCDCSEYMRNGDFTPNRFDAQKDAVNIICSAKTEMSHENTVGLIAMGKNKKAEVLVNCASDIGRMLAATHKMNIGGSADILIALQTAQLALKHRKIKKQTQRIILFVGSPVECPIKLLIKAGKRLKKNNVAVDIINFGEEEHNTPILEKFLGAVNSNENSRLITVPGGTDQLLSDALVTSNIFSQQVQMNDLGITPADATAAAGGAPVGGGGGGAFEQYGGIDPNQDPEMAMAMQMSLMEVRQRQEAEAARAADDNAEANADAPANANANASAANENAAEPAAAGNQGAAQGDAPEDLGLNDMDIDFDDEELMQAFQMSMMEDQDADVDMADAQNAGQDDNVQQVLDDDQYMDELLRDLPGINAEDVGDVNELLKIAEEEDGNEQDKSQEDKAGDKEADKN